MPDPPRYWFPAKTYGWGWGLPSTWEGWLVLVVDGGRKWRRWAVENDSACWCCYPIARGGVAVLLIPSSGQRPPPPFGILEPVGVRPPQPVLTAAIASRADLVHPVFEEAFHGQAGESGVSAHHPHMLHEAISALVTRLSGSRQPVAWLASSSWHRLAPVALQRGTVIRRAKTGHSSAPKTGHHVGGTGWKDRLIRSCWQGVRSGCSGLIGCIIGVFGWFRPAIAGRRAGRF
jgi:hypothetical protein